MRFAVKFALDGCVARTVVINAQDQLDAHAIAAVVADVLERRDRKRRCIETGEPRECAVATSKDCTLEDALLWALQGGTP